MLICVKKRYFRLFFATVMDTAKIEYVYWKVRGYKIFLLSYLLVTFATMV